MLTYDLKVKLLVKGSEVEKYSQLKFKRLLLDLKIEVEGRSINTDRLQAEKLTEDYETASLIADQTTITQLLARKTLYLKNIEEALERLDDGLYGECESCGDDINEKRLEVRPTTPLCIACKELEERNEKKNHSGILDWD